MKYQVSFRENRDLKQIAMVPSTTAAGSKRDQKWRTAQLGNDLSP